MQMAQCYEKLGQAEARKTYERLVRDYADQRELAADARLRLAALQAESKTRPEMAVRRVWAGPDVDIEGGVSPDGRYICFIDWSTGDLAIHDLVKGENRRLTSKGSWSSPEYADFATFSPDGKQVAYGWCDKNGWYDLRVVASGGSEPRILHSSKDISYFLPYAWSHDGKYILSEVAQKGISQIALVSTTDGSVRVLKSFGRNGPGHLSLSPDGSWIAYDFAQIENPGQHDVYLLASDGKRETRLIEHPADDFGPLWTPDGKKILFVSDRGGTLGFWLVSVLDGQAQGSPQIIKPDVGRVRPFDIAENGGFYYGLLAGTGDVYEVDIDLKSGKLLSAPAPAMKHYVGFNGTPDYSPDGQFLACISLRRGSSSSLVPGTRSLVVRSLKTGEEREFPLTIAPGWELKWSPDNRFVLLPGKDTKGQLNLYQVDVKTGEMKLLVERVPMNNMATSPKGWFPDQKSIYLLRGAPPDEQGNRQARIIRHYLVGRETQDIFRFNPDEIELRFATLSPDGKQFACWRQNNKTGSNGMLLIPVNAGEPRELFSIRDEARRDPFGIATGISWTPDGRYLVFARRTEPNKGMDLWRVAVTGGEPERVGPLLDKVFNVVVHPEGNRLIFSTVEFKSEVWVLENFLPARNAAR
jgi:Tol biopolymer transport system component